MDEYLSGSENTHRGDGIKLWIQPAEAVDDPTVGVNDNGDNKTFAEVGDGHPYSNNLYIWTLGFDDWSTDTEDASSDLMEPPVINADFDDRWQAIIAIPWSNLGYRKTDVVDGVELAIAFMRISSTGTLDEGYSGGLCWGKFMKDTEVWGKTTNNSLNTLILRDPDAAPATEEPVVVVPETEAPQSGPVAQIGDVVYDTFAEAVEAAREGDTIYLLRDAKEDDVVVSREIFFMINGEGGRYPNVTAGEGFTMKASGSPFNEYLGAYHFESVSEAPATEAPATEAPATEAPATEAPATEAPATEASDTEVINTDPPVIEPVDTETPATENPDTEEPAIGAPTTETAAPDPDADDEKETAPATEAPVTEAPATEAPATEAPATEAPATDAPATEAPVTAAPATETPATEAPVIDVPVTEEPATEPDEKSNTGLVIAIVAVVVVVGAGLGIVLGKKKK